MKVITQGGNTYRLSNLLSPFQEQMYIHLIDWKRKHITEESGKAFGNTYDAILPDKIAKNHPHVYVGIRDTLLKHKEKFGFRFHKHFSHMASSQAANINLFLPILHHPQAAAILSRIKPDLVRLATERLDHGYSIEFCDGLPGRLNDKTNVSGTDADLAIAYYNQDEKLCLWLIEHKLTEAEFTKCGGYKSKSRQPRHDCKKSFAELVENPSLCYYHEAKKFRYWEITQANRDFFPNHAKQTACPFIGGMNQLWRNQLLGLAIEKDANQPYEAATFSVVRHPRNSALCKTIADYQNLICDNPKFTAFTSLDVIAAAEAHADQELQTWINWYKELYNI